MYNFFYFFELCVHPNACAQNACAQTSVSPDLIFLILFKTLIIIVQPRKHT
jgi:hypothetical protein